MIQSSQAGIDEIVTEEDSGQAYYTKHYVHFEWPEGASGPTIGIGYDCGYSTADQIRQDWAPYVDAGTVSALANAAGLKGDAAAEFVRQHYGSVTITWDQAMAEFMGRELPKWEALCRAELPNYDLLPGDCAGAIDSLAYNRGAAGFHAGGDRYREMRAIHDHMATKRFDLIPGEFMSMRRLWPAGGDLWRRRGHEADLFQKGLATATAAPPTHPALPDTEWLQTSFNKLGADPQLKVDGDLGEKTQATVRAFQQLKGLPVTGVAGPDTIAAIQAALAAALAATA